MYKWEEKVPFQTTTFRAAPNLCHIKVKTNPSRIRIQIETEKTKNNLTKDFQNDNH